jgi:hypothetical protein
MEIEHYGKESGAGAAPGVFQGVDLEKAAPSPKSIGGEGVRELKTSDLDKPAETPKIEADAVTQVDFDKPVARPRPSQSGNTITLTTQDQQTLKYLRLVVALAEAKYFDQAIEALNELRGLGAG